MTKAALRERRRQERMARRNRNRWLIIGGGVLLIVLLVVLIISEQLNKPNPAKEIGGPNTLSDAAVTTADGLIYEDLIVGTGAAAKAGDTLSVTYTGWLKDGTVFDSNVDTGTPFEFPLGQGRVIPGWDEGLVGMMVGGSRLLVIPSALAYGTTGSGATIPPNSTLTFTVQLLAIK